MAEENGEYPACDREAEVCPRCSYFARYEVKCSDPLSDGGGVAS